MCSTNRDFIGTVYCTTSCNPSVAPSPNPFYATIVSEPRNGSRLYWKHGAGTVCPNGALIPVGDGAPYGHQPVGAAYGPVGATPLRTSRSLPRAPVFQTLSWGEGPGFLFVLCFQDMCVLVNEGGYYDQYKNTEYV